MVLRVIAVIAIAMNYKFDFALNGIRGNNSGNGSYKL